MKDNFKKYVFENYNYTIYSPLELFKMYIVDKMLLFYGYFKNLSRLKELNKTKQQKNSFKGYNAFVFAGGPSLSKVDFKKIRKYQEENNYKIITLNSYIINVNEFIPNIHVLSDPAFFGYYQNIKQDRIKEIEKTIEFLNDNDILCFIPLQFKSSNKLKKVLYFNDFESKFSNNVIDITKPRGYLSMTAYKALAIAYFLGFEKIYIIGFDNNWFKYITVNEKNEIFYLNKHAIYQADDGVHKVEKREAKNLGDLLYKHSFLFSDLYKFPKNIVNLDKESLVDAFSKEHDLDIYKH